MTSGFSSDFYPSGILKRSVNGMVIPGKDDFALHLKQGIYKAPVVIKPQLIDI
jgi:hypothetical protein